MIRKTWHRSVLSLFALLLLGTLSPHASAEIIDDITVHADANGDVDTVIKFTVPIQYLRHFPQGKTPYTAIYFNILGNVPADEWQNYESHRAPPSAIIQDITISTMDRGTGPKVQIKFFRPVEFSVNLGKTGQSLVIHIKSGTPQQNNESKTAPAPSGGASLPLAAVPLAVLPTIAKTPALAAPSAALPAASATVKPTARAAPVTAAPTKPAVAPTSTPTTPSKTTVPATPAAPSVVAPAAVIVAASAVAPAPPAAVTSTAPSGDVTAPNVVIAPSLLAPVHIPLGGKDGLPPFPDIVLMVPPEKASPSDKPTLTDQIIKANNQAATLMERAGNAILTGQTFIAIDSFNAVLNLPPSRYSQDAQLWIAISRERSGQLPKAILEFNTYLKLYPDGRSAQWVKDRLTTLKASQPDLFKVVAAPVVAPVLIKNTEFQYSEFGSLSMSYYQGASQTNTTATVGTIQTPTSFSTTDQKSLITNLNVTARSYNNEYDNRLVFQDFLAANFLPGQQNNNRLGAAYYELKDRIVNYSVKVGRQSGLGGGVMGRFDGVFAGYGFTPDYRVNVVAGKLADISLDEKPKFAGFSLDFGVKSPLGGSAYYINQTVGGISDRKAMGGNLRYFEPGFTVMSMIDYDIQFKALNLVTVQGTVNGKGDKATDYNFLIDRRRSPVLDVRNAISGTTATIANLQLNGFTLNDLILLANQRTTTTNSAQVGMTNHLNDKWIVGTDLSFSSTAGMAASGTLLPDGTTGIEGFVAASPSSGLAWTVSERLTGMGVIQPRDVTNFSVNYTKSKLATAEGFQFSNHADIQEKWALDSNMHIGFQSDTMGGKSNDISPSARVTYKARSNLTLDAQLGLNWTKASSSSLQSSSTALREFLSFGFRFDF